MRPVDARRAYDTILRRAARESRMGEIGGNDERRKRADRHGGSGFLARKERFSGVSFTVCSLSPCFWLVEAIYLGAQINPYFLAKAPGVPILERKYGLSAGRARKAVLTFMAPLLPCRTE